MSLIMYLTNNKFNLLLSKNILVFDIHQYLRWFKFEHANFGIMINSFSIEFSRTYRNKREASDAKKIYIKILGIWYSSVAFS